MQLSCAQSCRSCSALLMWTTIESTQSPITKAVESSANISIFDELHDSKQLGRSFVKMVKSLGPSKDPCGTGSKYFFAVLHYTLWEKK